MLIQSLHKYNLSFKHLAIDLSLIYDDSWDIVFKINDFSRYRKRLAKLKPFWRIFTIRPPRRPAVLSMSADLSLVLHPGCHCHLYGYKYGTAHVCANFKISRRRRILMSLNKTIQSLSYIIKKVKMTNVSSGRYAFQMGDCFNSYDDLLERLEKHSCESFVHYWRRDTRTVEGAIMKTTRPISKCLKYYSVRYACIHGGQKYSGRGEGRRQTQ